MILHELDKLFNNSRYEFDQTYVGGGNDDSKTRGSRPVSSGKGTRKN
uniref:Uncharacterized protein n=1 Tax=viral metagenome TaxID=1070528 RepID=A0A6C0I5P8_9ZZZZ